MDPLHIAFSSYYRCIRFLAIRGQKVSYKKALSRQTFTLCLQGTTLLNCSALLEVLLPYRFLDSYASVDLVCLSR